MDDPTVSIVIPTYNRPNKLSRAVDSVLSQTYEDWELIIVNDHPETDIGKILPDNKKIRYIQHEKNQGAPIARNNGIASSNGRYIALLDDDDAWKPKKLEYQVGQFKSIDDCCGMVYTGRDIINKGRRIERFIPCHEGWLKNILLEKNIIPSETPLILNDCFENVGMFDPGFPSVQDLDLWLRIANKYKISMIQKSLAKSYVGHKGRISDDIERKYRGYKLLIEKYEEDYQSNPSALATKQRQLGLYAAMLGQRLEGLQCLLSAYRYNPKNWPILLETMVCLTPSSLQKVLFNLREKISTSGR